MSCPKFSDEVSEAIADLAHGTQGGRLAPRMILEDLMLDLMYYLPSYKKVREFQVTKGNERVAENQSYNIRKGRLASNFPGGGGGGGGGGVGARERGYSSRPGEEFFHRMGIGARPGSLGEINAYIEGKARHKTSVDDAHP